MRINCNISSIIARNALNNNDTRLSDSIKRLSSGLKINSAADDAAGLAISLKMNAQIKSLQRANQNANDGVSVVNTADGAMSEVHDILQRMNELAIQSANGTNADSDREQIQLEIDQLIQEVDRIAETTQFNAQNLLDGSFAYKGYSNTENIKVKSYSDSVISGTYAIGQLSYYHYEDTIKDYDAYIAGKADGEVTSEKRFSAKSATAGDKVSADDIKKSLVTSASITDKQLTGLRAFPDSSKVILDDENIIIKADDNFEVTLTVNDRDMVQGSGATTVTTPKYYTTDNYRNISVTSDDGTKYNITNLNFVTKTNENGQAQGKVEINDGSENNFTNLRKDLAKAFESEFPDAKEVSISSCSYNINHKQDEYMLNGQTVTYSKNQCQLTVYARVIDANGNVQNNESITFNVVTPSTDTTGLSESEAESKVKEYEAGLPEKVRENNINSYLHSHTETVQTKYTVGGNADDDEYIKLNLTGMGAMRLQVGANEGQVIEIEIPSLTAYSLGVDDVNIKTEEKATEAIDKIGDAINRLSGIRAKIGAYANRIEHTITNLDTTEENMTSAYSRIMDVDMATEMTEYSTMQVLVQSSTSMLAQANERPQQVLQLLQ